MTRAQVPKLTVKMFQDYRETIFAQTKKYNRVSEEVGNYLIDAHPDAGFDMTTVITKISMPFMYSKRVIVNTFYPKMDERTNGIVSLSSSILNE